MKEPYLVISGNTAFAHFNELRHNYSDTLTPMSIIRGEKCGLIDLSDEIAKRFANRMNIIRFLAIASIVWGHSAFVLEGHVFNNIYQQCLQSFLLQAGKIGTILFFMISGFFLAGQIDRFSVIGYLRYRLFSLILPWFIFLSLAALVQTTQDLISAPAGTLSLHEVIKVTIDYYKGVIFYGAYWFIPVSVFSAVVLITLKKHVNKMWIGTVLLSITVFYSINLHYRWITTSHTKAVFGYVFFMWLGVRIKNNIQCADKLTNKLSWKLLLAGYSVFWFGLYRRIGFKANHLRRSLCLHSFFKHVVLHHIVYNNGENKPHAMD